MTANIPLLALALELTGTAVPLRHEPTSGPVRVQCVYCHQDGVAEEVPDVCPTCGDPRICVSAVSPEAELARLQERLSATAEWEKLRDRLRA